MQKPTYKDDLIALYKISQGDLDAYRYLFDSYFTDLCNFLLIYLHDRSISEEIALDLFVNLWENRENIQINSSFKGYLFTSAKYKAISHLRKERKEILSGIDVKEVTEMKDPGSSEALEVEELRKIIDDAINNLPEKSRIIYRMAWEEKLSHKVIAKKLGISSKTVENQVGIALKKLRISLKPYYEKIFLLCLFYIEN